MREREERIKKLQVLGPPQEEALRDGVGGGHPWHSAGVSGELGNIRQGCWGAARELAFFLPQTFSRLWQSPKGDSPPPKKKARCV